MIEDREVPTEQIASISEGNIEVLHHKILPYNACLSSSILNLADLLPCGSYGPISRWRPSFFFLLQLSESELSMVQFIYATLMLIILTEIICRAWSSNRLPPFQSSQGSVATKVGHVRRGALGVLLQRSSTWISLSVPYMSSIMS